MIYLTRTPREPLPEGTVLVHNHVVPRRRLGANGFRAWTQPASDELERCDCNWAGLVHYRVRNSATANEERKREDRL